MSRKLAVMSMAFMLLSMGLVFGSEEAQASSPTVVVHTTTWYVNDTTWVNDSIIYMEDVDLTIQYEATLYLNNSTMQFNTTSNQTRIIDLKDNASFYADECLFTTNWSVMYWVGIYMDVNVTMNSVVQVTNSEFDHNDAILSGDNGYLAHFENVLFSNMALKSYSVYSQINTTFKNVTFQGINNYTGSGLFEISTLAYPIEVLLEDINMTQIDYPRNDSMQMVVFTDGGSTNGMNLTVDGLDFETDDILEDGFLIYCDDTNATIKNVNYDGSLGLFFQISSVGYTSYNIVENVTGYIHDAPSNTVGTAHLSSLSLQPNNLFVTFVSNSTFITQYQNASTFYDDMFTYYYVNNDNSQTITSYWNTSFISPDDTVEHFHFNDGSSGSVITELSSCNITGAETLFTTGSFHRNSVISKNTDYWNYQNVAVTGIYGADSTSLDLLMSNGATFERDFIDDININLTDSPLIYQPLVDTLHSSYINGSSGVDFGGVMGAIGNSSLNYIDISPTPFPNGADWWRFPRLDLFNNLLGWLSFQGLDATSEFESLAEQQVATRDDEDVMPLEVSSLDLFMNRTGIPNDGITIRIIIPGTTNVTVSETNISLANVTDGWHTYDIEDFTYEEGVNYSIQIFSLTNQTNGTWNIGHYSSDDYALTSSALYTKDAVGEDNWTLTTGDLAFRLNVDFDTSYIDGSPMPFSYVENSGYLNTDTYNNNSYVANMTFDVIGSQHLGNVTATSERFGTQAVYWEQDIYEPNFDFQTWDEYDVEVNYNYSLRLKAGWNLVSIPVNVTLSSGQLFALDRNITQITALQGGLFVTAVRALTNISAIRPYTGVWIFCIQPVTINLTGTTMNLNELVDFSVVARDQWTLKGLPLSYEIFSRSRLDRNVMNFHDSDFLTHEFAGQFFTSVKGFLNYGHTLQIADGYYVWRE